MEERGHVRPAAVERRERSDFTERTKDRGHQRCHTIPHTGGGGGGVKRKGLNEDEGHCESLI